MSKRANGCQVVGTSALKADSPRSGQARIIAFPGAMEAPSTEPAGLRTAASAFRRRALSGLTREELQGRAFGRATKGQAAAFGVFCFLFALAVAVVGL